MIDVESAWKISTGSSQVTVLIADNGCDLQHPDLVAKMDGGFDPFNSTVASAPGGFIPNVNNDNPGNEHGTACSGIVAASTDNGIDVAGTCPDCRLRCARLLPAKNETSTVDSDVLTYGFALDKNVDIVSNSWGFVDAIPVPGPLKDAIEQVESAGRNGKGAVVVFASGNDNRIVADDELLAVDGIIGVGAVDSFGELTQFSNGGDAVDVVAPTGTVTTDISGSDGANSGDVDDSFGGTSSACPVVSGVAGLLIAKFPDKTGAEIANAIIDSAKQSTFATPDAKGHDQYYGFGLVQAAKALDALAPKKPAPKPAAPKSCASAPSALWVVLLVTLRRRRR
jgi:subtilisin family serine protease